LHVFFAWLAHYLEARAPHIFQLPAMAERVGAPLVGFT
jgi:hypothetical protein